MPQTEAVLYTLNTSKLQNIEESRWLPMGAVALSCTVDNTIRMGKGDPRKPNGKMSIYAFLMQKGM